MARWGSRAALTIAACGSLLGATASAATAAGWSYQTAPDPPGAAQARLAGVSCSAPGACTAVGGATSDNGLAGSTLAERWNGTAWALQTTPVPSGAVQSELRGVSCRSAVSCIAVGAGGNQFGVVTTTLAERWDGHAWSLLSTPNAPDQSDTELQSVSCTSPSACTAVGFFANSAAMTASPVAERWDGTGWSLQSVSIPELAPGGAAWLYGVSCATQRSCIAVGYDNPQPGQAGFLVPFSERWNGTGWSVQRVPVPAGTTSAELTSVSCTAPTACTAAGSSSTNGFITSVPLAERWNGTAWSLQSVPVPRAPSTPSLNGVSCATPTACTGVGTRFSSSEGLAVRWNGSTWSVQSLAASGITLNGVSCATSLSCVAVGQGLDSSGHSTTFAAGWTGPATARTARHRASRRAHRPPHRSAHRSG